MKRKFIIISFFAIVFVALQACKTQQIKKNNSSIEKEANKKSNGIFIPNTAKTYITLYKDIAIKEMNENGIPASITLAQGILESNFGNSDLAKYANNHFGIKCTTTWKGKGYFKDDDQKNDCFRVYKDAEESFKDHSDFLKRKRYAGLFQLDKNDYKGWAKGLKEAGYATNPNYANLLINTIEKYDLTQFDQSDTEKAKIARQDKIFGDINAEMAQEDAKYTPVSTAPKGVVTTKEAESKLEQETQTTIDTPIESQTEITTTKKEEGVIYKAEKPKITQPSKDTILINQSEDTYTVQAGDGLYRIARMFSLTVDRLKQINGMTSDEINVGQVLVVRDNGTTPTTLPVEKPNSKTQTTDSANTYKNIPITGITPEIPENTTLNENTTNKILVEVEITSTYYTVVAGDTFYKIAKEFSTTIENLKKLNPNIGENLQTGQEIKVGEVKKNIYKDAPAPTKKITVATSGTYTVQKGDSLFKIAKQFNLNLEDLKSLNNLSSDGLQIGQILKVSK